MSELPPEMRERALSGPMLIISKTNAESTVHRRARMDYIGVKKLRADGSVAGEHRFLGLFTSQAYAEPSHDIPILRQKLTTILDRVRASRRVRTTTRKSSRSSALCRRRSCSWLRRTRS